MNKFSLFDITKDEKDEKEEQQQNLIKQYINPLNSKNIKIEEKDIMNLLGSYDVKYKINDMNIYNLAFIHKSYLIKEKDDEIEDDNLSKDDNSDAIELQKYSNEVSAYQAQVNTAVQEYTNNLQADTQEYQQKLSKYSNSHEQININK